MSARLTRRHALGALSVGAMLPVLGGASAGWAASPSFAPPAGPMVFRRKLRRQLGGEFSLTVDRGFEIGFERVRDGFLVTGGQIDAAVDAPENLAAYARLERERREEGMVPLLLEALSFAPTMPSITRSSRPSTGCGNTKMAQR